MKIIIPETHSQSNLNYFSAEKYFLSRDFGVRDHTLSGESKISILGSEVIIGRFSVFWSLGPSTTSNWDEKLSDGSENFRIDSTREFHK